MKDKFVRFTLKYTRRAFAMLFGAMAVCAFLDIYGVLPSWLSKVAHLQIGPTVAGGEWVKVLFWVVMTLIFGRFYCSVICPLGILQDVILRFKRWYIRAVKKQKRIRYKYKKPLNIIRYGFLAVTVIPLLMGGTYPLMILDPYSNFGRIATSLFRPVLVWVNNILAGVANNAGSYSLYAIGDLGTTGIVLVVASLFFVTITVMTWRSGRLYCNTICPVGTLLGLFSRFSLFRVALKEGSCTSCTLCASNCKANCIDVKSKKVDMSRCVGCMDCLTECKSDCSITYSPTGWRRKEKTDYKSAMMLSDDESAMDAYSLSRRRFIAGSLTTLAMLPTASLIAGNNRHRGGARKPKIYPLPPGALSMKEFREKCTACQLCVEKCPQNVLQPANLEHGLLGMMQPIMKFSVEKYCNYECNVCCDGLCPSGAITKLTLEQKKVTQVGVARFIRRHCRVAISHVDCGACAEHCPTGALHMVPYGNGLAIPKLEAEYCIGCGACTSICPMTPLAVVVHGVEEQTTILPPSSQKIDREIDDFGF